MGTFEFLKNLKEKAIMSTAGQLLKGVKNGQEILKELGKLMDNLTTEYKKIENKYGKNFLKELPQDKKNEAINDIKEFIHKALTEIDKMQSLLPEQKKAAKKQTKKQIIKLIKNSNPEFKKMKTKQIERMLDL